MILCSARHGRRRHFPRLMAGLVFPLMDSIVLIIEERASRPSGAGMPDWGRRKGSRRLHAKCRFQRATLCCIRKDIRRFSSCIRVKNVFKQSSVTQRQLLRSRGQIKMPLRSLRLIFMLLYYADYRRFPRLLRTYLRITSGMPSTLSSPTRYIYS